jgi:DNA-binding MarR family transcriptional regulator
MHPSSWRAIQSWARLNSAIARFDVSLRQRHGVTALQLAVLRSLPVGDSVALSTLRELLHLHPATLGQAVDELFRRRLVSVTKDPADRRAKRIALKPKGRALIAIAPLAGPDRLREIDAPQRVGQLALALDDAITLFGLAWWAPPPEIPES